MMGACVTFSKESAELPGLILDVGILQQLEF